MGEYLITLSLLIAAVILIRGIFKRHISPRVTYALWLVVVIRLCLPFSFFEIKLPMPDLADREVVRSYELSASGTRAASRSVTIPQTDAEPEPAVPVDSEPVMQTSEPHVRLELQTAIRIVWLVGSVLLALWFAITDIRFHHQLTTDRMLYKTVCGTKVYISRIAGVPCLKGLIPSIYITPEAVNSGSQTLIIGHEYAHLRHGDHIWTTVRILALIAYWWNPLVWAAAILSKYDAELACDDAVSAKLNEDKRFEYAHIIIDTIPQRYHHVAGLGSEPMKERIIMLTQKRKNNLVCVMLSALFTVSAMGGAFIRVSGYEPEKTSSAPISNAVVSSMLNQYGSALWKKQKTADTEVAEIVDASLDILISGGDFTSEQAYIDANPEAFERIVELGEAALPYLNEISGRCGDHYRNADSDAYARSILAMAAAYRISPELYDLTYPSPDNRYAIKASVRSFYGIADPFTKVKYNVSLIECETGDILVSTTGNSSLMTVEWSADSRYAAVMEKLDSYLMDSQIIVYDVQNRQAIPMPDTMVYQQIHEAMPYKLYCRDIRFGGWVSEYVIRIIIDIKIGTASDMGTITGWYTYDLVNEEIIDIEYARHNP